MNIHQSHLRSGSIGNIHQTANGLQFHIKVEKSGGGSSPSPPSPPTAVTNIHIGDHSPNSHHLHSFRSSAFQLSPNPSNSPPSSNGGSTPTGNHSALPAYYGAYGQSAYHSYHSQHHPHHPQQQPLPAYAISSSANSPPGSTTASMFPNLMSGHYPTSNHHHHSHHPQDIAAAYHHPLSSMYRAPYGSSPEHANDMSEAQQQQQQQQSQHHHQQPPQQQTPPSSNSASMWSSNSASNSNTGKCMFRSDDGR